MSWVIRQVHVAGRSALADEATTDALAIAAFEMKIVHGVYLEWSDPDAKFGMGDDQWTDDLAKAKRFATFKEALECWKARSTLIPTRPDGKPNRPLTAYSVTIEEVQ